MRVIKTVLVCLWLLAGCGNQLQPAAERAETAVATRPLSLADEIRPTMRPYVQRLLHDPECRPERVVVGSTSRYLVLVNTTLREVRLFERNDQGDYQCPFGHGAVTPRPERLPLLSMVGMVSLIDRGDRRLHISWGRITWEVNQISAIESFPEALVPPTAVGLPQAAMDTILNLLGPQAVREGIDVIVYVDLRPERSNELRS